MTENSRPRRLRITKDALTTLVDLVSVLLICGGVAAIYWPAALILAGVAGLLGSWRASASSRRRER
jgi:hypothetical protein